MTEGERSLIGFVTKWVHCTYDLYMGMNLDCNVDEFR